MKLTTLFLGLITTFNSFAAVTVVHTSLQARSSKGKDNQVRTRIVLCEQGRCKSLVKSAGYTAAEWNRIGKMCKRSQTFAPLGTILKVAGEITGAVGKTPGGAVTTFILGSFATSPEEQKAVSTANRRFSSVMNVRANSALTVSEFYHLTEGIKTCAGKLEDHYRHIEMGKRLMYK